MALWDANGRLQSAVSIADETSGQSASVSTDGELAVTQSQTAIELLTEIRDLLQMQAGFFTVE